MKRLCVRGIVETEKGLAVIFRRKINGDKVTEYYVIPGGGVENTEDLEAALKRELQEELKEAECGDYELFVIQLAKINCDLECISDMNTPEEIVKSGKLNKLKRLLIDFSDENSDLRKSITGAKNITKMIN